MIEIHCPIQEVPVPDLEAFEPLLGRLRRTEPLERDEAFPRGTLRADGRLDLCKQDTGVLGCQAVMDALRESNLVHSLLLGTNGIGDQGAGQVAQLLEHKPLRTVYLGCNLIGAAGAQALAQAVREQPEVRALWLKRNPIGPQGAQHLAQLLAEAPHLRTLDVVHTGIGDEGARALLRVLAEGHNTTLEQLYLSGNSLTPAILPELLGALEVHPQLKGLYLSVNPLGDQCAEAIAALLPRIPGLRALGLASAGLSDAGLAAVLRAADQCQLQFLDLGRAPSTRVLGGQENRAGSEAQVAAEGLTTARLQVLQLPRMPEPERVLEQLPAGLSVRMVGHASAGQPLPFVAHPDTADIRSVYR